jgi:hypothetical protein
MTLITTQCVVPHSVHCVRHGVKTVQEYPQFLPGCDSVRLMDQGQYFLVADTSVSGFVFRTRMHWSETDGDVFFHNTFVSGVWHMVPCTPEELFASDGGGGSQNGCTHHTHIRLRITIAPGLFTPILRTILAAALPSLQRAFQKRLDDRCNPF